MRRIAILAAALIAVLAAPAQASFPGVNGRVAYLLPDADGFWHIWTANPDLSDARQLTGGAFSTWDETWSADGRELVYSTDRYATAPPPDPGFRVDIAVRNLDTGTERLLTHGGINEQPSFSPDGTRVLYASTDPTTGEGEGLFTIRATDGGGRRKVVDVPAGAEVLQWPRYSPDGSTIAFAGMRHPQDLRPGHSSDLSGATGAIYTVNADGTKLRRITAWGTISDSQLDWSPDGTRLVFETNWRPGTGPDLWIINADGTGLRNLTDDPNLTPSMPFRASFDPTWAPDGSLIMFNCAPGALSLWDLCTIRPDGTGRTTVAATEGDEDTPAWQPVPVGSLR
jgi:Tol biopolymer transport system component